MSKKYKSIEELISAIDAAENSELRLLEITIERAGEARPELAEALRYCAIPSRFNAEIIGILEPDHRYLAEGLIEKMRDYEFLLEQGDGWYLYHDSTRDLLLDSWRSNDNLPDFSKYNNRMISYYEGKREEANNVEEDWRVVASIILSANSARYYKLATSIEQELLALLIEILYHKTLQSAEDGYRFFEKQCFALEQANPTICLSLLNVTRNYLKLVAPKTSDPHKIDNLNLWLDYFEARLNQNLNTFNTQGLEKVKRSLQDLMQKKEVKSDTKLYIWILNQLGIVYDDLAFHNDAYEAYSKSLSLSKEYNIDLFNLAVYYSNLARIHWTKRHLEKAIEYYEIALQEAKKENNRNLEITSLSNQCRILQQQGKWENALTKSLDILHAVWTRFPQQSSLHKEVMWNFFYLFTRKHPQLLRSTFQGLNTFLDILGDPRLKNDLHSRYIDRLVDAGLIRQAEIELIACLKVHDQGIDPVLGKDLLYRQGFLFDEKGDPAQAAEKYIELHDHKQATPWDKAAANDNLAGNYLKLGNFSKAQSHLQQASNQWKQLSMDKLYALAQVKNAHLLLKQSKFDEAQIALDSSLDSLFSEFNDFQAVYHHVQGKLYELKGNWSDAQKQYQLALEVSLLIDHQVDVAKRYMDLAHMAANQARWKETVEYTNKANLYWRKLRNADDYQLTRKAKSADNYFTDGLKVLFASTAGTWEIRLASQQVQFSKAAKLQPESILYTLYWMYTSAKIEDWPGAIQAASMIIEHAPDWIRHHPFIEMRLVEYCLNQGVLEMESSNYDAAINLYEKVEKLLHHPESVDQITTSRIAFGDSQLAMNNRVKAQDLYLTALDRAKRSQNLKIQADCYARLGFLATIYGDKLDIKPAPDNGDNALSNFSRAIELYKLGGLKDSGVKLGEICKTLVQQVNTYWLLVSNWQNYLANESIEKSFRNELAVAQESLSGYLQELYLLSMQSAPTANMSPAVTPVVVEIEDSVLPEGPDSEWELFKTYLPEMRQRIQSDTGIEVPGIRIRSNNTDLPRRSYIIMLDEVPLVLESIQPNKIYCRASLESLEKLNIPSSSLIEKYLMAVPGCWVDIEYLDILKESSYDLWEDPLLFMVNHLEGILRNNLAQFLGTQEVARLLEQWKTTKQGAALIEAALPDHDARLCFANLLRALAKEKVPLTSWEKILTTVNQIGLAKDSVDTVVRAVRLQLKELLPGNNSVAKQIYLPSETEEKIAKWMNNQSFLAILPEDTQELLTQIRELVSPNHTSQVLVVHSAEIRPHVRRLVELEHPALMVISQDEILSGS